MEIPHGPLASRLSELVALFNAQKLDLPDRALHKDCVFRLNGRAYHDHLGRPPSDPLIRLIGCGPAGYRLLLGAVRHAAAAPTLRVHTAETRETLTGDRGHLLSARATLSGRLRSSNDAFATECGLSLFGDPAGSIREIAVTMGDADVEMLLLARRAP